MERVIKSIVASILLCIGTAGAEEGPPAASPVNRIPNGSFEVGSAGWMLVENQVAGTRWGVAEGEARHGLRSLFIDRREAVGGGRTRLQGPWFEHGETALLVSAMARADEPGEVAVGLTHGEIAGWRGRNPLSARETFEIGPEWRRITLRVPRSMNRPRGRFGQRNVLGRTSHTKSMVYFEMNDGHRVWIDAVQVNEGDLHRGVDPPAFQPAAPVELGWSIDHGGIFHDRPRFEAVVANHGDARWSGWLHVEIGDYFGNAVQLGTEGIDVEPGCSDTVEIALRTEALGFYNAALTLVDERHAEVAREHLTMVRAEEGFGSEMIAITSSMAFSDNRVRMARSLQRLGFPQARVYHACNWEACAPAPGAWNSPAPLMDSFFGKSGVRTQVNFQNAPEWVRGPEGRRFEYPPEHRADFAEYVRRAVVELRPWLSSVSFVNEPNAHFHGSPQTYRAYAIALHEEIEAVAPDLDVLGIQPGGFHLGYVRGMLEEGGERFTRAMDVLAVQTHPPGGMPVEEARWDRPLAEVRDLAREFGIGRIWSTEMGYRVEAPEEAHMPIRVSGRGRLVDLDLSERGQADHLTRAFLFGLATTFERMYAFHFTPRSPSNGILFPWSLSRCNHLVTPRPVLAALSVANRLLAGTDERGMRDFVTPGLWGATFAGDGRRVDALWSVTGPQHVRVTAPEAVRVHDIMGNRIPLAEEGTDLLELGESPVYLVADDPGRDPVAETLSVTWAPETVWSGSPFRGVLSAGGEAEEGPVFTALRVRDGRTGRALWSADAAAGAAGEVSFAFDLDAPFGELPLAVEGVLEDGRILTRRFELLVLGGPAERAVYERGEPVLVEDFAAVEVDGTEGRSPRGIAWSAEMIFPWHNLYGEHIDRALTATNGFVRVTVEQPVGPAARGAPNWPALDAAFDEPRRWLAYQGLRIRYRMDRVNEEGRIVLDPDLSAAGISMRLGDVNGNLFFIRPGRALTHRRDGDWYVSTVAFDEVPGLTDARASVKFLSFWANESADNDRPFGFSLDRIETLPRIEQRVDEKAALREELNFDE
jgi:hypothetical protein